MWAKKKKKKKKEKKERKKEEEEEEKKEKQRKVDTSSVDSSIYRFLSADPATLSRLLFLENYIAFDPDSLSFVPLSVFQKGGLVVESRDPVRLHRNGESSRT